MLLSGVKPHSPGVLLLHVPSTRLGKARRESRAKPEASWWHRFPPTPPAWVSRSPEAGGTTPSRPGCAECGAQPVRGDSRVTHAAVRAALLSGHYGGHGHLRAGAPAAACPMRCEHTSQQLVNKEQQRVKTLL